MAKIDRIAGSGHGRTLLRLRDNHVFGMRPSVKLTSVLLPVILGISLLGIYLGTMAPALTWANYGSDGGDLIAAARTGGVAHPSGYPLYLQLARLFQLLPLGPLAFRTNLLSAIATMLAALLLFELMMRSNASWEERPNWGVALVAAYAFGLAPLVWSQAVITEVYGLQILLVVLILYLSSVPLPDFFRSHRLDLSLGLAFGLGLANHLTTALLLPLFFSALPLGRSYFPSLLRRLAGMVTGLLFYLTLPLRALQQPPINWGNPATLDGFRWLVTGSQYQAQLFSLAPDLVWERARAAAGLLIEQAGPPGLIVAVMGLVFFFKPSTLFRNVIWMMVAFFAFALAYGTADSFVYLTPVWLGVSIWIGTGLGGIAAQLPRRFRPIFSPVFILLLFFMAGAHWHSVDASHDLRAESFGREVLSRAPRDAIVFANGDKAIFTLWYFHFALSERTDLVIVARELLPFDWYQQNLHAVYPEVQLPGPFPFAETMAALNPDRPVCFVEYTERAQIQCRMAAAHEGGFRPEPFPFRDNVSYHN